MASIMHSCLSSYLFVLGLLASNLDLGFARKHCEEAARKYEDTASCADYLVNYCAPTLAVSKEIIYEQVSYARTLEWTKDANEIITHDPVNGNSDSSIDFFFCLL